MKVGIITLHNHNFGSALQCYATQHILESKGYMCDVIDIGNGISFIMIKIKTILSLLTLCIRSPRDSCRVFQIFMAQRSNSLTITKPSLLALDRFNNTELHRVTYTEDYLKGLAATDTFGFFLSGSDQVWNGSRVSEYNKYFLRFAPVEKRASWAASFGEGTVARYNKRKYCEFIKEFRFLSVREYSGKQLVNQLTGKDAALLCDPVMMLDADSWREKETIKEREPYILAFFINHPSTTAQKRLHELREKTELKVRTFGYQHPEIENSIHEDGGPWDFLSVIDNADLVLTDSYHAVVFATLFHKRFYVFERMYSHGQSQSSRITDFLNSIQLGNRFNPKSLSSDMPDYGISEGYFKAKKDEGEKYLETVLKDVKRRDSDFLTVRDKNYKCSGCGACSNVCTHHAIKMTCDEEGFIYPIINAKKCVGCGLCRKICAFEPLDNLDYQQKSYIAAGKDVVLNKRSASGGMFAALAKDTIKKGGLVFGASLWMDNGIVHCDHIGIDKLEDLWRVQGSKYVQCDTKDVFFRVKEELKKGRRVLFGGTSCQVAGLRSYLRNDYENLLTTDLVCHGVPSLKMLQDYLDYLSSKYGEEIVDFRFRIRSREGKPYMMTVKLKSGRTEQIGMRESSYYRMFMACAGYRPSCYDCPFASINKPGDITLADYYAQEKTILSEELQNTAMLSSVIVNTVKGSEALKGLGQQVSAIDLSLSEMEIEHELLQHPSFPTLLGDAMFAKYKEGGFAILQNELNRRNLWTGIGAVLLRFYKKK